MITVTKNPETGITLTIKTADSPDGDIRETRHASKGEGRGTAVELRISVAGERGLALTSAATKDGGRSWSRGKRVAYRTADAAMAAAELRWARLLAML